MANTGEWSKTKKGKRQTTWLRLQKSVRILRWKLLKWNEMWNWMWKTRCCLHCKCTTHAHVLWWLEFLMPLINQTATIIIVNVANIKRPLSLQMHSVTQFDSSELGGCAVCVCVDDDCWSRDFISVCFFLCLFETWARESHQDIATSSATIIYDNIIFVIIYEHRL